MPLGVAGGGRELVFGLVATNAAGDQRSLAFLSPEAETGLEHELARLALELSHPERARVGVISSFANGTPPGDLLTGGLSGRGWQVIEATRAEFDYRSLRTPLSAVPSDIDVLWILHPKNLDRMTLASIDRYARSGGALLVQVDPLAEVDRTGMSDSEVSTGYVAERESDLPELLAAWGLKLVPRRILADRKLGRELPAGSVGNQEPVTFPHWLGLRPDDFETNARTRGLFANLRGINFASAGVFELLDNASAALERRPLLRSSADSMRLEASLVQVIKDPASLMRDFVPGGEQQLFGVELIGQAPAAFPNETVIDPRPMRAFVIADVDCSADVLWVREKPPLPGADGPSASGGFVAVADNGVFIARLLGELTGGADLGLAGARRAGARYTRPFTRFDQLERAAEERLARELSAARALETELRGALATASADFSANGGAASTPPEVLALEERLANAREQLKRLLRERDAEVDRLKAQATYWCGLAWPLLIGLLALFFRRRP